MESERSKDLARIALVGLGALTLASGIVTGGLALHELFTDTGDWADKLRYGLVGGFAVGMIAGGGYAVNRGLQTGSHSPVQ